MYMRKCQLIFPVFAVFQEYLKKVIRPIKKDCNTGILLKIHLPSAFIFLIQHDHINSILPSTIFIHVIHFLTIMLTWEILVTPQGLSYFLRTWNPDGTQVFTVMMYINSLLRIHVFSLQHDRTQNSAICWEVNQNNTLMPSQHKTIKATSILLLSSD